MPYMQYRFTVLYCTVRVYQSSVPSTHLANHSFVVAIRLSATIAADMQLRILTFNIFFDAVGREPRMRAIGRLVERARPAVVGFQEVTRETLALLKAQVRLRLPMLAHSTRRSHAADVHCTALL